MSNDLTETQTAPIEYRQEPMTVQEMRTALARMREYRDHILQKGIHYGEIPGCGDKPALLKPGAEVIAMGFRAAAEISIEKETLPGGHLNVDARVRLVDRETGQFLGEGVGSCSSMESRYRYRSDKTKQPVPPEYWKTRDPALLGGDCCYAKKVKNEWFIFRRVEHSDPADYWNTVIKMAKKRAFVDATLTLVAASECFCQEDIARPPIPRSPEEAPKHNASDYVSPPQGNKGPVPSPDFPPPDDEPPEGSISAKQAGRAYAIAKAKGWPKETVEEDINALCERLHNCRLSHLHWKHYKEFVDAIEMGPQT